VSAPTKPVLAQLLHAHLALAVSRICQPQPRRQPGPARPAAPNRTPLLHRHGVSDAPRAVHSSPSSRTSCSTRVPRSSGCVKRATTRCVRLPLSFTTPLALADAARRPHAGRSPHCRPARPPSRARAPLQLARRALAPARPRARPDVHEPARPPCGCLVDRRSAFHRARSGPPTLRPRPPRHAQRRRALARAHVPRAARGTRWRLTADGRGAGGRAAEGGGGHARARGGGAQA